MPAKVRAFAASNFHRTKQRLWKPNEKRCHRCARLRRRFVKLSEHYEICRDCAAEIDIAGKDGSDDA